MTLTDIISKITQYAKKLIVNDNSSTTAASITQAGAGDALSITGTTGTGASITTTAGTALKLQQNSTNPPQGGTLEFFKSGGGDMVFDGANDGIFVFQNTSAAATKATVFTGANVGIGESNPSSTLHVGGGLTVGRTNAVLEGAEIIMARAVDNQPGFSIDVYGSGINAFFRILEKVSNTVKFEIDSSNGNVGIATTLPQRTLHVNGTVRLQGLPTYANNAAALAGGLVVNDVYKTAGGDLLIVV
jgi:hypothetical protein